MLRLECINLKSLISLQICDSYQTAHILCLSGSLRRDRMVACFRRPSTLPSGSRLCRMQRAAMRWRSSVEWRTFMCQGSFESLPILWHLTDILPTESAATATSATHPTRVQVIQSKTQSAELIPGGRVPHLPVDLNLNTSRLILIWDRWALQLISMSSRNFHWRFSRTIFHSR
jgi:hypothetical protein